MLIVLTPLWFWEEPTYWQPPPLSNIFQNNWVPGPWYGSYFKWEKPIPLDEDHWTTADILGQAGDW